MIRNKIVAERFGVDRFTVALRDAAGSEAVPVADQIRYLARYCMWLGAETMVREEHYVDRHFLDEHAAYYSRSLQPTPNCVRRFHLFRRAFTDDDLAKYFDQVAALPAADSKRLVDELSVDYLGFVTIRPIPSVPVGRTVLKRLSDGAPREIWAIGKHEVHLANLKLNVEGIVFQQQDLAVGACATAALWSALSVVCRREGMRAPTPAEVSAAAGRHLLPHGRTMPAVAGLTNEQLSEAIRSSGMAPEAVHARERPELFVMALHAYLRSGIPVLLALEDPDGQHAVTAVGFQFDAAPQRLLEGSIPVRSARIKKLYVHDDRLGPYARAFLTPLPLTDEFGEALLLQIENDRNDQNAEPDPNKLEDWIIDSAIVPVYPKLRLSVRNLITLAEILGDLIEHCVGDEVAPDLGVEFFYERGGTYLQQLNSRVAAPCAPFLREVALPRWCGIVRWFIADEQLVEFVYDTTDILRDTHRLGGELLLAMVCLKPEYRDRLKKIADYFAVPHL